MIVVLDQGSVGNYQASCHNPINLSAVIHLYGQPSRGHSGRPALRPPHGRISAERGPELITLL
jgi:hypothetical protein